MEFTVVFGIDVVAMKCTCTTPLIVVTGKLSDLVRVIRNR